MRSLPRLPVRAVALFAALPSLALAHPGHDGHDFGWDFSSGLAHPFSGWDHLLAMVAVGLWAAQLGGRARWLLPLVFVSVMSLGAALGHVGVPVVGLEQGIAASVFVLGLLIAGTVRLPLSAGCALVGLFALFHGFAHGAEMPATSAGLDYGFGFVVATLALHALGLGVGTASHRISARLPRVTGGVIACCAALLLV